MNNHEKALFTYNQIQKRKKEVAAAKEKDIANYFKNRLVKYNYCKGGK